MRFSLISAIATLGSVVMAQPVARTASSQQVVDDLSVLTKKAQDLQAPANSLSIFNAPGLLLGQGPWTQFGEKECTDITGTFRGFVSVNQAYLNILIGKTGSIGKIPFVDPPMSASLTAVKGTYDALSNQIIKLCPSTAQELTLALKYLDETLDHAIKAYQPVGKN
ncbi:hypothetical protein N0V85_008550 [Neurospora sp. IMI 360204]|nr:hypothetical protein N0V85_008550 [Neurospora sp. IMI 360204]